MYGNYVSKTNTGIQKSEPEDALQAMEKKKAHGTDKLKTKLLQQIRDKIKKT